MKLRSSKPFYMLQLNSSVSQRDQSQGSTEMWTNRNVSHGREKKGRCAFMFITWGALYSRAKISLHSETSIWKEIKEIQACWLLFTMSYCLKYIYFSSHKAWRRYQRVDFGHIISNSVDIFRNVSECSLLYLRSQWNNYFLRSVYVVVTF